MSTPSTSHQCPDFQSLPARNLAPDYSYSRLIHNQGCNLLIKEWNSLLPSENSIALTILNDLRMLLAFKEEQLTGERTICLLTRGPGLQRKGLALGAVPPRRRSGESLPSGFESEVEV
ncbi:hypothetical protein A4A49_65657 [Nicotiana attenuata]|uniref:Uncharacterized protein n=1 Tax=Nicotiana attenuata TaxID=49451 RepID=A0A1J6IA54_NICAT|nr:hypothetical protein A4A49_56714 [Nicotiana attenuata]OIT08801.1 hypothetical protein A4A49_63906 [Nicotiana attenuata]OIT08813.1 hypothetical protein A4A49_65657 [Nicotiana attenuata]